MASEEDYDYYYSNEDSHSIFYWDELIPTLIVYGVTFVIGLIGNCLIIFTTFRYRRMQNVTNVLLASLACADLLLIIICLPVKVAKLFSYTWEMGEIVCKTVYYMQNVSAICSVLTLTAISIERYYAIVHPIRAKYICTITQARRIIMFIWIMSLLLGIPTIIVQIHLPVGTEFQYFWCVRNWENPFMWKMHEIYMLIVILIGPFCIMTLSYTMICREVWKVLERRSIMTSDQALTRKPTNLSHKSMDETFHLNEIKRPRLRNGRDDTQMVKQVICMLVAVVVVFALCWGPLLIDNVLTAYGVLPHLRLGYLKYMSSAFHLMAYFNSCLNPIIYGFMSKHFRDSFFLALCCSGDTRNHHRGSSYSLKQISRTSSQTKHTSAR